MISNSASLVCSASRPPLSSTALPLLRHSPPIWISASGRDSKITPTTPMGQLMRESTSPSASSVRSCSCPMGSSIAASCSRPAQTSAELVLVKLEPLERGRGQPFLFGLPHIDIVRFEDLSCFRAEGGGNRQQRAVARLARRRGQRKARLLGGLRHVGGGHFPIIHTAPLSPCSAWPFRRPAAGFRSSPAPPSAAPFRCGRLRP